MRAARQHLGVWASIVALHAVICATASAATYQATVGTYMTPGCSASSYFSSGMTGTQNCSVFNGGGGWSVYPSVATIGAGWTGQWQVNAPAGLTITSAFIPLIQDFGLSNGHGWNAGGFWSGGSDVWAATATSASTPFSGISSPYFGFKLYCNSSSCPGLVGGIYDSSLAVPGVNLTVAENQGPSLNAIGATNLWYEGGRYVWNPSGDPFSVEFQATDASGVCDMSVYVGSSDLPGPSAAPNRYLGFQECPSPLDFAPSAGALVDTNLYVALGSSGSFQLQLNATNAAGLTSSPAETVNVDNVQPSVSLTTPNDANAGTWVNHPVTLNAVAHTGPSGLGALSCTIDHGPTQAYSSGGVTIDGSGVHAATCTATNNAVDPQGNPNIGTSSMSVKIDETPPALSIERSDPADPTQLVVDTSDTQSGVAGGSIEMRPVGSRTWQALPTASDGSHLVSSFDDSGLSGPYEFQATSCDQVGNCASTSEHMTMPVRLGTFAAVSFRPIVDPLQAKKIRKRIRVGWHYKTERRHGKQVRVKVGGHMKTISVIKVIERCRRTRIKIGPHHWMIRKTCKTPRIKLLRTKTIAYGRRSTIHGLLRSAQGVPITGVPVDILTAPDNGKNVFTAAATARTDSAGRWTVTLPAGPSRIIKASYQGSETLLPATGKATVLVRARVKLWISPNVVPWGSVIRITGRVLGGHIPTRSKLLQLYAGIGQIGHIEGLPDIKPDGRFVILWKFDPGHGVIHPWFTVGTLPESAFPYAPSTSRRVGITLGRPTPRRQAHK